MSMYRKGGIVIAGVMVLTLAFGLALTPVLSVNMAHAEGIDDFYFDDGFGYSGGGGDYAWDEPMGSSLEGGCDWDCYGYQETSDYCDWGCYDDDYEMYDVYDDYYEYDDYGYDYGGGSFGGYSYTPTYNTGCMSNCGGSTYRPVTPTTSYFPAYIPSSSGSQQQEQQQTQTTTVTNTNTNVNVNNNTAIAVVQVGAQTATQPTYPTTPTYPAPYCSIYQAQSYGNYGTIRPVYLSWNSSNAQSAYLSNYGSVSVNGSQTVYPTYSTTYTLTVYGYNGQQATCQTTVQMSTYIPPVTPITPYVSLTQIPYTGFDFGTFGNAMYFAAIAIVALGGAYLAVYFIPQVATARGSYKRTFQHVAPKAPILVEKEAAAVKVAPIVASLKTGTNDTMAIVQKAGSMPKIVIDRS